MALTTQGSLYGQFEGNTYGDNNNSPFNSSNATNPNLRPKIDLFQILRPGGACLLQVTSNCVVNTNVAAGSFTKSTVVATVQLTEAQALGLGATPTAAQTCAAAFPQNYNNQKLDLFQIASDIASPSVKGGGREIGRLTYAGAFTTS